MKLMVLPFVIGTVATVPKRLEKEELEIGERHETIQTIALLNY